MLSTHSFFKALKEKLKDPSDWRKETNSQYTHGSYTLLDAGFQVIYEDRSIFRRDPRSRAYKVLADIIYDVYGKYPSKYYTTVDLLTFNNDEATTHDHLMYVLDIAINYTNHLWYRLL
jgi:hypothetical protein